jgi:hypothetical protein
MLLAFVLVLLWLAIDDARNHSAARMTPVRIALPRRGTR